MTDEEAINELRYIKENEIIPYEDKIALVNKIEEVMNGIHKREEEDDEHVR